MTEAMPEIAPPPRKEADKSRVCPSEYRYITHKQQSGDKTLRNNDSESFTQVRPTIRY